MSDSVKYGRMVNLTMNLVLGLCMSLVIFAALGAPVACDSLVGSWFASFCIGYCFGDIIPVAAAGQVVCDAMKLRNPAGRFFVNAVVMGLYFGMVILLGMSIVNNLPTAGWDAVIEFFIRLWPTVVVSAIVLVAVFMLPAQKVAAKLVGFEPSNAASDPVTGG